MKNNAIINILFRPLYSIYRRRKEGKRVFLHAKELLNRGGYYIPFKTNEIKKVDKEFFSLSNLACFCFFVNKTQGKDIIGENSRLLCSVGERFGFGIGQGKCVLLTNDRAIGFYETSRLYSLAKDHFLNNYNDFNYPHVEIIGFEDSKKLIVMNNVKGVLYSDKYHDEIIVRELMKLACRSVTKLNEKNEIVFLQHGDAKRENIMWSNDAFVFIDLDNIQYLPPLFDVFHYLNNYGLRDICSYIEKNKSLFREICLRADIDVDRNPLDIMFSRYVQQYIQWGVSFHDFGFLKTDNLHRYPKTMKLLQKFQK